MFNKIDLSVCLRMFNFDYSNTSNFHNEIYLLKHLTLSNSNSCNRRKLIMLIKCQIKNTTVLYVAIFSTRTGSYVPHVCVL